MTRIRQLLDQLRHRLVVVPIAFVILSMALSQLMVSIDRSLGEDRTPDVLLTSADSGRAILTAIAGGLITSITLLLSMMLVTVQIASGQFSPRTVRNWLGDRSQQAAVGLVLGSAVYSLLVLRQVRSIEEGGAFVPHLSIMLAVALGVLSLVAVVRSVDHLTNRLRIGSIASDIVADSLRVIDRRQKLWAAENPAITPASGVVERAQTVDPPPDATPVTARESGWIQQVDQDALFKSIPEGATAYLQASIGSFVIVDTPLLWVWNAPLPDEACDAMNAAIAIGDARTMQQGVGFGILQMTDIAMRALSPGVNDPNTANDMIMHLGAVLLKVWDTPVGATVQSEDERSLIRHDLSHADYLQAAFDPIRRHGAGDPSVSGTLLRALVTLHTETIRRDLQGPLEPIEELAERIVESVERSELCTFDKNAVRAIADHVRRKSETGIEETNHA